MYEYACVCIKECVRLYVWVDYLQVCIRAFECVCECMRAYVYADGSKCVRE